MKQFKKTKLAAAVGTAALAAGLTAPVNAVVVVGGDNGWEISFDGNVNAFLTFGDFDEGYAATLSPTGADTARITSGFLPAFFSFNAKSPTVNGLTGTARISFAPTINNGGAKTQFSQQANSVFGDFASGAVDGINGATIDTREVVANVDGSFGQISFGRTLSHFGRQAILGDMTLFGVGFVPGPNHFGSVTFGRVGNGYTYPDFSSRIAYTTPSTNGFQLSVGAYDPSIIDTRGGGFFNSVATQGFLDETDIPRFEGELSYNTTFNGGTIKIWGDGLWQEINSTCSVAGDSDDDPVLESSYSTGESPGFLIATTLQCDDITAWGVGGGGSIGFAGFNVTGYYYTGEALGLTAQFNQLAIGSERTSSSPSKRVTESDSDGFYVQGTYTFNGRTKVGVSYGESNVDIPTPNSFGSPGSTDLEVTKSMWTAGVYHDITSWLKVIAEYNHGEFELGSDETEADTFSVGSFIFW
jgi:hypothetical protein